MRTGCRLIVAIATLAGAGLPAVERDPRDQLIDDLLKRVDALEQEVKRLKSTPPAAATSGTNGYADAPDESEEALTHQRYPNFSLRGFGDVNYYWSDRTGAKNTFALGQLDLFITSQLAENVSVLNENVIEASGEDNSFIFEIERLLLQYAPVDYLKVGVGRYHTEIGYYNTAYHHGTWFQTATGRPYIFDFEDEGGPLPVHNVGITVNGHIPSGKLDLHYVVEVGNGRDYNPGSEPVLNVQDNNGYKAVNVGFKARPAWVSGLEVGVSAYHDRVDLTGGSRVDQLILAAYAAYARSPWEWLTEGQLLRHDDDSGTHWTPAFYTQFSRQFGAFRPYVRFEYINAPDTDPIFNALGNPGCLFGPTVGLRYDFTRYACVKAQYDHRIQTDEPSVNSLTLQVAYTF